ncbi:MAG: Hsp20/alpha crystallin family protein [Promethearchaeota archaeon]
MEKSEEKKNVKIEDEEISESEDHKKETSKEKKKNTSIQLRKSRPLSLFGHFDQVFDELDRYFNNFWKPSRYWNFEPFTLSRFDDEKFFRTPLTNVKDEGDNYSVTAELPGLDKGDIEISIHDGILEIKGEQKEELEEKKEGFMRREYHSSSYHRSFTIPENVDEDHIDAKLDKGVLTLKLPKKEEEKKEKKKIEIQ